MTLTLLHQGVDGTVRFPFAWPREMELPLIDINDTGKYLAPAIRNPTDYDGKRLVAVTAYYTAGDIVDTRTKISGRKTRLITLDEVPEFVTHLIQNGVLRPGALLLKYKYFGLDGPQKIEWTRSQLDAGDRLTTWEEFLTQSQPLPIDAEN